MVQQFQFLGRKVDKAVQTEVCLLQPGAASLLQCLHRPVQPVPGIQSNLPGASGVDRVDLCQIPQFVSHAPLQFLTDLQQAVGGHAAAFQFVRRFQQAGEKSGATGGLCIDAQLTGHGLYRPTHQQQTAALIQFAPAKAACGLENAEDLLADLEQAIAKV